MSRLRISLLTLAAVGGGYGLWLVSGLAVAWSGADAWLPVIRLGTIILGLTVADLAWAWLLRRAPFLRQQPRGEDA
jgi:hypothetical protein